MNTEIDQEPLLTMATLVNNVVRDFLFQNRFAYAHFPEIVDLAVIGTGLGMLQSHIGFVNSTGSFWDSSRWDAVPRPFLDSQSLAYAWAIAAWIRDERDPVWSNELPGDVKRPLKKSLKYLFKTGDSFIQPSGQYSLDLSQADWLSLASTGSASQQIVAIRQLDVEQQQINQTESVLLEKLQSRSRAILLQSIDAVQRMKIDSESIAGEIRMLAEHRDDEVRAKAMCALTLVGMLDEATVRVAAKMLDSNARFVVFAGVFALTSLDQAPDDILTLADRGLVRALQTCDYEFVGLYAAAFNRWFDDPESHFRQLLAENSPDYLEIALEALENVREQMVSLG